MCQPCVCAPAEDGVLQEGTGWPVALCLPRQEGSPGSSGQTALRGQVSAPLFKARLLAPGSRRAGRGSRRLRD